MNYSTYPIIYENIQYSSIKDCMDQTGKSRYLIKKKCIPLNENDLTKFKNSGRRRNNFKSKPTKEELLNLYDGNVRKLARHYSVSEEKVKKLLEEYNIQLLSLSEAILKKSENEIPLKEELVRNYQGKSIKQLADFYGIGKKKIRRWLNHCEIPIKSQSQVANERHQQRHQKIKPSKEKLNSEYSEFTIYELALTYSVDKSVIRKWLDEYNIDHSTNHSRLENLIFKYCKSLDSDFIQGDRNLIYPYEIDIISHKHKLAIEVCGIYWHSDTFKNKEYHQKKYRRCKEAGYTLITVFETDDLNKVYELIKIKLGKCEKRFYGRNCKIEEIDSKLAKEFHKTYHFHDSIPASVHLGLYHGDELCMVGSFSKSRYNKAYEWECARMTTKHNSQVVGGASKLFSHFFKFYHVKSCVTYSDLRFGEGNVYSYCGFTRGKDTPPNYFYHKNGKLFSRVFFQKHKLKKHFPNLFCVEKTEKEIMTEAGYDRIYDCGNAFYFLSEVIND